MPLSEPPDGTAFLSSGPFVTKVDLTAFSLLFLSHCDHAIPAWELKTTFDPVAATRIYVQRRVKWIRWPQGEGGPVVPSVPVPFQLISKTPLADLWVRDSRSFLAGAPHKYVYGWEYLTQNYPHLDKRRDQYPRGENYNLELD